MHVVAKHVHEHSGFSDLSSAHDHHFSYMRVSYGIHYFTLIRGFFRVPPSGLCAVFCRQHSIFVGPFRKRQFGRRFKQRKTSCKRFAVAFGNLIVFVFVAMFRCSLFPVVFIFLPSAYREHAEYHSGAGVTFPHTTRTLLFITLRILFLHRFA